MLPQEINPEEFLVPPNADFSVLEESRSNSLVFEENQVDTVIINNVDVRGDQPSIGTLFSDKFTGMGMGQKIYLQSEGPFTGIDFEGIEVMTFNFGNGVDSITVESTSEAIHIMNLGGEEDDVNVKSLSGPLIINGQGGDDTVLVSSDNEQLGLINALLAFDGGDESSDGDVLILDNSEDYGIDDVLNVTRLMIEVESMDVPPIDTVNNTGKNPILPRDSYLINLQNSTDGSFVLSMNDTITHEAVEATLNYSGLTADAIEDALTTALFGSINSRSCGQDSSSYCADSVKVVTHMPSFSQGNGSMWV